MLIIGGIIAYILIKGLTIQPIATTTPQTTTSTPTTPEYETNPYDTKGY